MAARARTATPSRGHRLRPRSRLRSYLYGARICSFVVYLLNYHFLPEDRLAELVSDLFGLAMVPANHRPDERSL
jgi:hypothetical protein